MSQWQTGQWNWGLASCQVGWAPQGVKKWDRHLGLASIVHTRWVFSTYFTGIYGPVSATCWPQQWLVASHWCKILLKARTKLVLQTKSEFCSDFRCRWILPSKSEWGSLGWFDQKLLTSVDFFSTNWKQTPVPCSQGTQPRNIVQSHHSVVMPKPAQLWPLQK